MKVDETKIEKFAAPFIGAALAGASVWMIMLYVQPIPVEIFERHADVNTVRMGDTVTIEWKERRTAECSSIVSRRLIASDGKLIEFEPVVSPVKPIGERTDKFSFTIPPIATSGVLTYRASSRFTCNWVQKLFGGPTLPLQDVKLDYIAPEKGAG